MPCRCGARKCRGYLGVDVAEKKREERRKAAAEEHAAAVAAGGAVLAAHTRRRNAQARKRARALSKQGGVVVQDDDRFDFSVYDEEGVVKKEQFPTSGTVQEQAAFIVRTRYMPSRISAKLRRELRKAMGKEVNSASQRQIHVIMLTRVEACCSTASVSSSRSRARTHVCALCH